MADISKCSGKDCPLKTKCYRYTAPSNEDRQAYIREQYREGNCEYFWNNVEHNVSFIKSQKNVNSKTSDN